MTSHTPDGAVEQQDITIELTTENVAAVALTSEKGWDILNTMYSECAGKMLYTQGYVGPVLAQGAAINAKLSDPDAFTKCFNTTLQDLKKYQEDLSLVYSKHQGRSGTPVEADWDVLFTTSQAYSNLAMHFDTTIVPLILAQIEVLREEFGDILDLPAVGKQEGV